MLVLKKETEIIFGSPNNENYVINEPNLKFFQTSMNFNVLLNKKKDIWKNVCKLLATID